MRIAQEEIFGPVLTVMTFKDEEEAIKLANDIDYGLAGYVWTNDIKRGHRVAHKVEAGMLWVNAQNVRDLRTPFGGSKSSGIGREGGHYGFDFYTEQKIIHVSIADHRYSAIRENNREGMVNTMDFSIIRIARTVLHVTDLQASREFYVEWIRHD